MTKAILPVTFYMPLSLMAQGTFCDPAGNVAIYSNYDGGALTINVDQNIPDLHIGVVSYEFSRITLTGTYVSNVAAIWYLGYDADNDHCALGGTTLSTTISGAPVGADSILLYPPSTWPNANGNGNIICNYSCDISTSQGGCNTADQIAHWFLTHWGGTLLFHYTQYGCWSNGYTISGGGNCCENPLATGVLANGTSAAVVLASNVVSDRLDVVGDGPFAILDASGAYARAWSASAQGASSIDVSDLPAGVYVLRSPFGATRFVIARHGR